MRTLLILAVSLLLAGVSAGCGQSGRRSGGGGGGGGVGGAGGDGDADGDVWVAPEGDGGGGKDGDGDGAGDGGQDGGDGGDAGDGGGGDDGDPDVIAPPGGEACGEAADGAVESCGAPVVGTCDPGWRWCVDGSWTDCANFVGPTEEACDGLDNDCDGVVDGEGHGCAAFDDGDPDALGTQIGALNRVNEHRAAAGLPLVKFNPALNRAATNHAEYHRQNGGAHGEQQGRPGFTGANPGARAAHEDYDGPPFVFEDMAFGVGPAGSVDMWFHSVYHRVAIVRPDAVLIGFGSHPGAEVLNVAVNGTHKEIHALVPYDGQQGVPRNFHSNREGPDPVPGEGEVGYPISVTTAHQDVRLIEVSVVTDGGEDLDLYEATVEAPHRGFLNDSVFVMPQLPMAEDTWHTVDLTYTAGGATHQRVWRFKTGSFRFR